MARGNNWCKGFDEKETEMIKETGGNAFPHENHLSHRGMTLRDYFAAKAMQGFTSTIDISDADYQEHFGYIAKDCYEIADAMLEASPTRLPRTTVAITTRPAATHLRSDG